MNRRVHFALMIIWVLLALPTVLWWKDSVLWVGIMSLYAIVVSHWTAYLAAKTDEKLEDRT